jgi:hypothetical protein
VRRRALPLLLVLSVLLPLACTDEDPDTGASSTANPTAADGSAVPIEPATPEQLEEAQLRLENEYQAETDDPCISVHLQNDPALARRLADPTALPAEDELADRAEAVVASCTVAQEFPAQFASSLAEARGLNDEQRACLEAGMATWNND